MRQLAVRGLLALAILAWAAPGALAKTGAPVTIPTLLPANRCGFEIDVGVVENHERQTVTTLSDGTTITKIRGRLILRFTNHDTGRSIVRNVSGPTIETDHFDAEGNFVGGTFVASGSNWFGFGPVSQANTGEPGLVFTDGQVSLQLGPTGVTSFALTGRQVNGCALLA